MGIPAWALLLPLLAAVCFAVWLLYDTDRERHLPGDLYEADPPDDIYDWAGTDDFHPYKPNREKPGQCAALVDGRPCLMSRAMHDG